MVFVSDQILAAQRDLIVVMGELATARVRSQIGIVKDGFHLTTIEMVDRITSVVFDLEKDKSLYPKDWVDTRRNTSLRCISISRARHAAARSGASLHSASKKKI